MVGRVEEITVTITSVAWLLRQHDGRLECDLKGDQGCVTLFNTNGLLHELAQRKERPDEERHQGD